MKIYSWDIKSNLNLNKDLIICLGSFETLHLGHNELFKIARNLKNADEHFELAAMMFQSPINKGEIATEKAFQPKTRLYTFDALGFDSVFIVNMDKNLLNLDYKIFIQSLKENGVKKIVCGQDFRFGFMKKGTINDLKKEFEVYVADEKKVNKSKISSTLIKEFIRDGNIEGMNALLIENYAFITTMEKFHYKYPENLIPLKDGVYIVNVVISNIEYHGLTLINKKFESEENKLNNILYLYDLEIIPSKYEEIYIEFIHRIRYVDDSKESKFSKSDLEIAQRWFIENL
ncbi:FAD synthase [Mycoplasma phocoeninasale]|uniref:FAD synthase n=1 Tax=Mycoplasma phocoeninasale TaxID=2726117 RepID=A0A858U0Z5_9MOLU|nr:riboflavin biosynthesis protein [Mycoplasma phocoeninasale]MBN0970828.1 riboflavin biosynthesis protein [Mycoplasma phocoeninasale]QJG66120.1 riboflavin biosynthesis protein [Mycoplasma phocoeninasale]